MTKKLFLAVALFLGAAASVSAAVSYSSLPDAAVYNDFVVGPGKIELDMQPGETRTVDLTIANRLGSARAFSVGEEDFTGSDDASQPVVLLGDDQSPYSAHGIISLPVSAVDVAQGQKASIPVTISVPAGAAPGGIYGSVVVSVASQQASSSDPAGGSLATNPVVTRIASLFFIRVAGAAQESGSLAGFSIAGGKHVLAEGSPVLFDIAFKNSGNVHLVPSGTISVTNMLGALVGQIAVDPWFALPQSVRFREVSWDPTFMLGRYTAHLQISRGYASTTDDADVVFWVMPWGIIIAVIVTVAILVGLARALARTFSVTRRRS